MRNIFISLMLSLSVLFSFSQQAGITEKDLIKKANSFYDKEIWEEAFPLFAQLVSVYPENPEYNFKFGVCSLMGDRTNSNRAIRYLNIALASMPDNKELLYYLGLANYQNQEFAAALQYFFKSIEMYGSTSPKSKTINDHINSCQRGMELIHKNNLDEILVKTEFQYENFHRAYPADEFEGSLIQKPDHFSTLIEKERKERSYVYVTEPRGTVYYSGYGNEESTQRDIFVIVLNEDGEWGEAKLVSSHVNTPKDEAYPVLADDGKTLYFASKGHNSMGGYDIFKSTFNELSGTFDTPENMGIGINSPFDDILFIPIKSGNGAYFTSNRESTDNNITVYQISLNNGMIEEQEIMADLNSSPEDETPTEASDAASIEILDATPKLNEEELAGISKTEPTPPAKTDAAPSANNKNAIATANGAQKNKSTEAGTTEVNLPEQSEGMKIKWALVYDEDETETENASAVETNPIQTVNPVTQVQMVKYAASQTDITHADEALEIQLEADLLKQVEVVEYHSRHTNFRDLDEDIEIHIEANPVEQVQMVKYAAAQVAFPEDEESLELIIEPDPVIQVEAIVYENRQMSFPEEEELLEVMIEPEQAKQVEAVAYENELTTLPEQEELLDVRVEPDQFRQVEAIAFKNEATTLPEEEEFLDLRIEQDVMIQVEAIAYESKITTPLVEDESLEVNIEPELLKQVETIDYVQNSNQESIVDEEIEVILEVVPLKQVELVDNETTGKYELQVDEVLDISQESNKEELTSPYAELSSLTAAENGMITMPETIDVPQGLENKGSNNQLIKAAMNKPEDLSYEELLYAASLTDNEDAKLKIYYNSFIRIDRDWRAYYNASVAARKDSNPEQAEVYLYQARLIYDEEFMGQMDSELEMK